MQYLYNITIKLYSTFKSRIICSRLFVSFIHFCNWLIFVTGATATLACLLIGLDSFRKGESKKSQIMMRGRVLAQGFTVASFALGILYTSMKKNLEAQPKPTPQPDN